jgi:methylated-DNA-[protein]-cysteine S-methyltransferase
MLYFDGMTTPIGRLHIVVSDKALLHIYFPSDTWTEEYIRRPLHPLLVRTKKELKEYFAGKRKKFTVPIEVSGTPFQQKAWMVLRSIPYGETVSYSEQAKRLRKATAARAVGSANGKNPIPIIVPCHRAVAKGGGLGGYAGGLSIKRKLLALEQRFT